MAMAADIITTCDICDDGRTEARTIRFMFHNQLYDIDVCIDHLKAYATFMEPYLENARRAEVLEHKRNEKQRAPRANGRVQLAPWVTSNGRVVQGERRDTPSKCPMCGRTFTAMHGLAVHVTRKHTVEECEAVGWPSEGKVTYDLYLELFGEQIGDVQQASINLKGLVKG